jgi:hypothetical protein
MRTWMVWFSIVEDGGWIRRWRSRRWVGVRLPGAWLGGGRLCQVSPEGVVQVVTAVSGVSGAAHTWVVATEVARLGQSLGVVKGGGSALGVFFEVVDVADRGSALDALAVLVAGDHEVAQGPVEAASFGIAVGQRAVDGVGQEPAQPGVVAGGEELSVRGGQRPSADEVCWLVGQAEKGGVGHHHADMGCGDGAGGQAGEAFDQGVAHQVAAGAGVTGGALGLGVFAQAGVCRHGLFGW